jgi:hypothetical protein
MADIEIRVTSKTSGDAFGDLQKQAAKAKDDLKAVANAANIDGKVSMDLRETDAATRILREIDAFDPNVDIDINADISEVEMAEARLRDLDTIPPPNIKVKVDDSSVRAAGDNVADALGDGGEQGAAKIAGALGNIDFNNIGASGADQMASALAAAGPWAAAAGSIAAVFGDDFLAGFNDALPAARTEMIRGLRYNLSGPELTEVGTTAANIYSSGFAGALTKGELREAVAIVKAELGSLGDDIDLTQVTKEALLLAEVLGVDLTEAISTAESLVARQLVPNVSTAMNLMLEMAQKTGVEWEEMQELINEFGPALKALGIDAGQGFDIMATIFEQRLTPQLDQAGEIFEELNENITNGGAAEALEKIGLNAETMTNRVISGGPDAAKAISEIATAILAVEDPTERADAAIAIFGGNVNLMGAEARDAILELFTMADGTREVGTALSDATDDVEETATGIDRLKKIAADAGTELGNTAAQLSEALDAMFERDWDRLGENIKGLGDTFTTSLLGPVGELLERTGNNPFDGFIDALDKVRGKSEETGDAVGLAGRRFDEAGEQGGLAGRRFDEELAPGLDNAKDSADELASAVDRAKEAFDAFGGRFDEAELMRKIEEETIAATEAVQGLEEGTYKLGEGFDRSTEKGRNAEAALEDLSGVLDDAKRSYENGSISAQQLADTQVIVEGKIRQVAAAMGAGKEATEELVATYGTVPSEVSTMFNAYTQAAAGAVAGYAAAIAGIPRVVNTTLNQTTYQQTIVRPTASVSRFGEAHGGVTGTAATGGIRHNMTLVGEHGPELVDLAPGSYVHSNPDTERILGGQSQTVEIHVHVHGSVLTERDLKETMRDAFYRSDVNVYGRNGS